MSDAKGAESVLTENLLKSFLYKILHYCTITIGHIAIQIAAAS